MKAPGLLKLNTTLNPKPLLGPSVSLEFCGRDGVARFTEFKVHLGFFVPTVSRVWASPDF